MGGQLFCVQAYNIFRGKMSLALGKVHVPFEACMFPSMAAVCVSNGAGMGQKAVLKAACLPVMLFLGLT